MAVRPLALDEREAEIAEALAAGPKTARDLAREIYAITAAKAPRSLVSRVTQSLRVMEREGIVTRADGRKWRLAR